MFLSRLLKTCHQLYLLTFINSSILDKRTDAILSWNLRLQTDKMYCLKKSNVSC